jgi:hypothetical protein
MRFAGSALVILIVGCRTSSSTAPSEASSAAFARHLDSLAAQACPTEVDAGLRCALLHYAEAAPAIGVLPSHVRVTTAAGPQLWLGSAFDSIIMDTQGRTLATKYVVVAYSDNDVTNGYLAEVVFQAPDTLPFFGAFLLLGDTLTANSPGNTPAAALDISQAAVNGACQPVAGLVYAYAPSGVCRGTTINVTISSTLSGYGLAPSYETFSLVQQLLPGVQFVATDSNSASVTNRSPPHGLSSHSSASVR